jgi:CheY-like chemotaxis protein
VLVIEEDEWESTLLRKVLVESSYQVEVATTARAGFAKAQEWVPDCIICDLLLPDIDGLWVARMVRLDAPPLSTTPFVFLAKDPDKDSRLQGFNVGADVFVEKPYRTEEVVAQVGALISMARRLGDRVSFGPSSTHLAPAVNGDLGQIDLSTVLTLLEMERRTGVLKVRIDGQPTVQLELCDGALARATVDGKVASSVPTLRMVLSSKQGRFSFRGAEVARGPGPATAVGPLLLEAMRLLDESKRS